MENADDFWISTKQKRSFKNIVYILLITFLNLCQIFLISLCCKTRRWELKNYIIWQQQQRSKNQYLSYHGFSFGFYSSFLRSKVVNFMAWFLMRLFCICNFTNYKISTDVNLIITADKISKTKNFIWMIVLVLDPTDHSLKRYFKLSLEDSKFTHTTH